MNSRRSFFKRLASIVAVVSLAPEIAFARKLEATEISNLAATEGSNNIFWLETSRIQICRSAAYEEYRAKVMAEFAK